jgi:hypothetical protein
MDDETFDENVDDTYGMPEEMKAQYRVFARDNDIYKKALQEKYYQPQREMWKKQEDELRSRRTGPGFAEDMFALAAAASRPSEYRGLAGTLAKLTPVLAQQEQRKREAEEAKREMLMKYGMKTSEIDLEQRKAEIEAARDLAKQRFNAMKSMFTPRPVQSVDPVTGAITWQYISPASMSSPSTGGASKTPPIIRTEAEFAALPSGTEFFAPDGTRRRKP